MQSVVVDPALLDGYAAQLERNAELLAGPLRRYCTVHCARTEGATGLLAAARPAVELAHERTAALFAAGERQLFQLATNLRAAAASYRAGDAAAAERIWLVLSRRPASPGFEAHDGARHAGDFRDPALLRLVPPADRDDLRQAVEEAERQLGVVDRWLRRYAQISLSDRVLPWLSGDWTTLREDADGYARLAGPDGVRVIAQNLAYGLDSLSAGWDSPAARQFCYTVREHWLPAIEALGHVLQLHARVFEWMAQQSENALKAIVLTVEAIRLWLVERALRLATLAGSVAGLGTVWRELADLGTDVLAAWHQLETILDMTRMALRSGVDLLGALGAEATLIEDLAAGRLAPLSAG